MHSSLRMMALFMALTAIFVVIGYVLGSVFFGDWILGSLVFLVFAAVINFISYFFSDKIVLWSYGAKPASKAEQPRLYNIINKVCLKGDMPMPKIAIIPTQTPNAFATGRNKDNAVGAATEGTAGTP